MARTMKRSACVLVVLLFSLICAAQARAGFFFLSDGTGDFRNGWAGNSFSGTIGYQFLVGPNPVTVTALGFLDGPNTAVPNNAPGTAGSGDGLLGSHQIGLWTTGGTLLATVTVDPSTGYLTGDFKYVDLTTPVILAANTQYRIGAYVSATDGDVFRDRNNGGSGYTAPTVSDPPFAQLIGGSQPVYAAPFFSSTNAFTFPTTGNAAVGSSGFVGPNLKFLDAVTAPVPEPSSICILSFGLMTLGLYHQRRRFCAR